MSDFDPTKHLRQLRGKGGTADYLDVKWRLVWLRSEHPDATSAVEHVEISPDIAIFRATVTIPGAGSATDYGSETPKDFGDFIEKAATKALGRALAQLGYGTQFVGFELDENTRIVDSPVDHPPPAPPARNAAPAFAQARAAPAPAQASPLPRLTEAELTATIDQAWANAEDGWALGAIRDDFNRQRHRMSKEQMDRTRDELAKIEAKFYAPASIAG